MSTAAVFGGEGAVPAEAFDAGPAPKRNAVQLSAPGRAGRRAASSRSA